MRLTVCLQVFIILNLNGMQFSFLSRDYVLITTGLCRPHESRTSTSLTRNGYTNLAANPNFADVYSS
jgi:hypothetical protein